MRPLLYITLFCFGGAAWAQQIVINVGTAAPEGSPWHQILQKTREDWTRLSNGKFNMRIYPSGTLGDENAMILKVRIGQLQAVALSAAGMVLIDRAVECLQLPMLIGSYEEFDYVRERISPRLETILDKKGFVVLQWSDVGWVHFFTRTPVRTPNDIRRLKLYTQVGDPEGEKLYREFGLQPVPLAVTDLLPSLQTNLIQAFDVPPLFALLDQSFALAPNMIDLKWAPLAGATLISRKAWDRIPASQQGEFRKAAAAAARRVRAEIRKMGDDAVVEMQKRKLNVIQLTQAEQALWRKEAEAVYPRLRGSAIPEDLFDEVMRLHNEFRATRGVGR